MAGFPAKNAPGQKLRMRDFCLHLYKREKPPGIFAGAAGERTSERSVPEDRQLGLIDLNG